jgi:hypothetical protein
MRNPRTKLAATATLATLALLAGVALAAGSGEPGAGAPPASTAQATPTPEVRTEVVHRTAHRRGRDDHGHHAEPGDDHGGDAARAVAVPAAQPTAVATVDDHGHHGEHGEPGDDHGGDRHGDDDSSGHGHGGRD